MFLVGCLTVSLLLFLYPHFTLITLVRKVSITTSILEMRAISLPTIVVSKAFDCYNSHGDLYFLLGHGGLGIEKAP